MGFLPKRKSRGPEPIGAVLSKFFESKVPKSVSEESRVFGAWPKAVGSDVSRQANPVSYKNGLLFVETRHPVWTAELQSKRHLILRKLNDALGSAMVKEIHFRQAKS